MIKGNGYYISAIIPESESGIQNKIRVHMNMFSEMYNMVRLEFPENKFRRKYLFKIPGFSSGRDFDYVFSKLINPEFVYLRSMPFERLFVNFLRRIKENYPNCKILIELPTYPYDRDEYTIWYNYFLLKKDQKYRMMLSDCVDRIVTYTDDSNIFGCKTLCVTNGIDCNEIDPVSNYDLNKNKIRLISVARLRVHHGFERLLEGLKNYNNNDQIRKVYLDIIGDGPEYEHYQKLITEYGLSDYVKMLGPKNQSELGYYYNRADIAVSSLGFYKIGLNKSYNLKNRDYMARGLPVISCLDDVVFKNNNYVMLVSNNAEALNINDIIAFYDECYVDGKMKVISEVRNCAIANCDITNTYKKVLDFLKGESIND